MNVLITSVGNKTNLIKYFRRALFNAGGGQIIGADTSVLNNARHFLDEFICSPSSSAADDYRFWLFELIESHKIDLIVPSRDGELAVLASMKQEVFERFSCRIAVNDLDIVGTCLDKDRFSVWCRQHNFLVPDSYGIEQVEENNLPIFIKPKTGSGSRDVLKVEAWAQWQAVKQDIDESFIIQSFIESPEYTIDVYSDHSSQVRAVIPRARLMTHAGESINARVELDNTLIESAARLAQALGLTGLNTLQCFYDGRHVVMSELNLRFGGGFTLAVEAGADSPLWLIQEAMGKTLDIDTTRFINGLEMLRIQKDIFLPPKAIDSTEVPEKHLKVYCFDLDGTICTENCAYDKAVPIESVVRRVNQLYQQGHKIIIATARGAASGTCWRSLVEQQLACWGVLYHEIKMEKPYADYYVDNKAVDILEFI
jgi:carbamoyl-phosphate synthase large subunit